MVNFTSIINSSLVAASLFNLAAAHPGEKQDHFGISRRIDARQLHAAAAKRSLEPSENYLEHLDLLARSLQRRVNALNTLPQKRGISNSKCSFSRTSQRQH